MKEKSVKLHVLNSRQDMTVKSYSNKKENTQRCNPKDRRANFDLWPVYNLCILSSEIYVVLFQYYALTFGIKE